MTVPKRETYSSFSAAVIAQLNAEISGDGLNRAQLARTLDIDYGTLGRYLNNKRAMPLPVFFAIIEQLSIDEEHLYKLARERFARK